jgi:hypothetical protein
MRTSMTLPCLQKFAHPRVRWPRATVGASRSRVQRMEPFRPWQRRAYTVVNLSTSPLWLAMVLAPRSALTARLVRLAAPLQAGLGAAYVGLLAAGWGKGEPVDFRDPETVRRGLGQPEGFVAGWAHYLAFDLFVGRWIWQDGLAEGRSTRAALLLTWFAGPAGLTLYLAQRARRR